MNSNQIIILSVFLGYLLFNVVVSFVYSRKAEKSLNTSEEKKYFIGGRNMNGIVLAMTIMATYTSASSFISLSSFGKNSCKGGSRYLITTFSLFITVNNFSKSDC